MDLEALIGTMVTGALQTGGKRSHRTGRFLTSGRSSFVNASTLLTVGGLIWGAIETMQQPSAGATAPSVPAPPGASPAPPGGPALSVPPPLPPQPLVSQPPTAGQPAAPVPSGSAAPIPDGAARLIKLMISAARADGTASETEREAILEHARRAGAEALVATEWEQPTPLASIVAGVEDVQQREDLYVLAYAIVRADEGVSGSEQIYLAQLASALGLGAGATARLEHDADRRIAEAGL